MFICQYLFILSGSAQSHQQDLTKFVQAELIFPLLKNKITKKKNKKNKKKQDHVYPGSEWVYPVGPGWSRLSIAIGQRRSQGRRPPWGPPLSLKKLVKHNHPFRFLFLFFSFSSLKKKCIGGIVDLQCCVSVVQQSDSVIHIHISTLVQILFPYRPLQNIEQSSLCYTVGPYQLVVLYIVVCVYQSQSHSLSIFPIITW